LPKGYQTTQMYQPIIGPGVINIPLENGKSFDVRIHHAHMEEDAGKLTHHGNFSLVDLNRAGTPLIEIVSEPDIHSSIQAKAFATELYNLMTYSGVTRGDLYHGNMRFDVNISTAPKGSTKLGTRSEVKNLNSFRSVERAAEYEFKRQIEILERGEKVVQETRGWDDSKQKTSPQRNKEDAQDYRYMPDADIPPVILTDEEITRIQADIPKLPPFYRDEWKDLGFDSTVINALLMSQHDAITLQRIFGKTTDKLAKRLIGLWFLMTTTKVLEDMESGQVTQHSDLPIPDEYFIELSSMVINKELSSTAAKEVLFEMFQSSKNPRDIAQTKNLTQVSNEDEVMSIVDEVLNDVSSAKAVADLKNGNVKVIGFLVGQVMKKSGGKANPVKVQELIKRSVK